MHLRKELRKTYGKIIQTSELGHSLRKDDTLFAVGDIVVGTLLDNGFLPKISIFDCRTERGRIVVPSIKRAFSKPIVVRNRPGTISRSLWLAIKRAATRHQRVGIRVYGEEDLASLACIHFAPLGAVVMYGIRGRGMNLIRVDGHIKALVDGFLLQMCGVR